jgi:hypothetical protein
MQVKYKLDDMEKAIRETFVESHGKTIGYGLLAVAHAIVHFTEVVAKSVSVCCIQETTKEIKENQGTF